MKKTHFGRINVIISNAQVIAGIVVLAVEVNQATIEKANTLLN